jgi:hypothetical protein
MALLGQPQHRQALPALSPVLSALPEKSAGTTAWLNTFELVAGTR